MHRPIGKVSNILLQQISITNPNRYPASSNTNLFPLLLQKLAIIKNPRPNKRTFLGRSLIYCYNYRKHGVADHAQARYADCHEMATLNAKLLLLTNQPKLTQTVTLTPADTVTIIFLHAFR